MENKGMEGLVIKLLPVTNSQLTLSVPSLPNSALTSPFNDILAAMTSQMLLQHEVLSANGIKSLTCSDVRVGWEIKQSAVFKMQWIVFTIEMRTPLHCKPANRLQMKFKTMSVAAMNVSVIYVWNLHEVSDRS